MGSLVKKVLLFTAVFFSVFASAMAQGLSLGSAAAFNLLASQKIINKGSTIVQGNVGVGSGAVLTGFAAGSIKGQQHINDAIALNALSDLSAAYATYSQRPATKVLPATIGNESFTAGVYKINTTATITGPVVLDANHDPNAAFIFQIGQNLQVNADITIALINGAKVNNVLWLVAEDAVIGQGAYMKGNIIANNIITLQDDAAVLGRVMSIKNSVNLSNTILSLPTDLSIVKTRVADSPAQKYAVGDLVTFKIEVRNLGPIDDEGVMIRDVLPPGLSYVSSSSTKSGSYYDPTYGLWIIDEFKVGEVQTLTITARATMAGYIVNTATIAGSTVDENLSNNKSDADLCVVLSDAGQIQGPIAACAGSANTYKIKQIAGATYTWTVPSDWVITAGSRNSSEITVKVGKTSGTISVTVNNICGASPPSRLTVEVVQDVPPKPGPISGTLELCSGKSTTYSIAPVAGAVGYRWTLPAGWAMVSDNGTSITVTTNGDATTKRLSVAAYNICGDGQPSILDVTPVLKVPDTPGAISGPSAVCATVASATYSIGKVANASSYTWSVPAGWTILSGQGTSTITVKPTAQAGEVTVKAVNDCGESTAQKLTVTPVENPPLAPGAIKGPGTVCANTAGNIYSIDAVPNAKGYTWSVPTGWTIVSGQNTPSITVTAGAGNGKITVVALNDCGSNGNSSKDVQVISGTPSAPAAIKGTPYGCATQTATYTIDPVNGAQSYTWAVPAGWTIQSGQGTTTITVKVGSGSGTISVKAKGGCGDGPATTLTVQPQVALPAAPVSITGPEEVCKNQTGLTYSVAAITGVTSYTWTVPTGWTIVSGQGTTTIKVTAGTTNGNISVTATNDCGTSAAKTKAIKVSTEAPATPGAISGDATVCGGQANIKYSIAAVPGATSYAWSAPGWTIVSGQGTTSITVNAGSTGTTISVIAMNACGNTSASQFAAVVTQSIPAKPGTITGTTAACVGKDQTYTVPLVAGATSYTWTVPTGWTIVSQNNNTIVVRPGTTAGNISVSATNGCGTGPASTLAVTPISGAISGITGISGKATTCATGNITFTVPAGNNVSGYAWEVPTGWSIVSGQGTTQVTVKAGATSGSIKLTASNDCGSVTVTKQVEVNTTVPANPGTITGSASACSGSAQKYSISPVSGAVSYTWSVPQGWTITGGQGTTTIDVKAGSGTGQVTVTATNDCGNSSSSSTKTVTITSSAPAAGAITGTTAICNTTSGLVYNIAQVSGATAYTWSVPQGWSIVSGQGTTKITVNAGANGGEIKVAAENACGKGANSTLAVSTAAPLAAPGPIAGNMDACSTRPTTTYSIEAVPGATGYAWEVPPGWTLVAGQGSTTITVGVTSAPGTIKVKAVNSCSQSTFTTLNVMPVANVPRKPASIKGPNEACIGRNVVYSIDAVADASSYTWVVPATWQIVTGQGTNQITVKAGPLSGNIEVMANNGCGSSAITNIQVRSVEIGVMGEVKDLSSPCDGLKYMVDPVVGATSYTWTLPEGWVIIAGEGTNIIMVNAGKHDGTISVVANNGTCGTVPSSIMSDKSKAETLIEIPNVFTPNNDGNHDTWVIASFERFPDNDITILNRWGTEVFKAKSYKNNWTGDNLAEGTYYYVARVRLCDGTDRMLKGYVMIVR